MESLEISPAWTPPLDPAFVPAVLWNRQFRALTASGDSRTCRLALRRPNGIVFRHEFELLPDRPEHARLNLRYTERLLKFLLWQKGASEVLVSGAPEVAAGLAELYSPGGARAFDVDLIGNKIFDRPVTIEACSERDLPEPKQASLSLGGHLEGCRIGFDLGGSDRKCAAVIDGEVVFSAETPWSPYFEPDPAYHEQGINDSLRQAAAHLPRVDAIGGSAAGVYIDNRVRVASIFRGVPPEKFESEVRDLFPRLQKQWDDVPFEVVNDGEVTALAGAMALDTNTLLGISLGTSEAVGYCNEEGRITSWLNELAFAPIDARPDAPADEWSGDRGCGVQYLSQQAVARLAPAAGFAFPEETPLPKRLEEVQSAAKSGRKGAIEIFESIGVYFGYALAHYAEFYPLRTVMSLGRVMSGTGGEIILARARKVLETEFPEMDDVRLVTPDEKTRRHGQAIAAASLPALRR